MAHVTDQLKGSLADRYAIERELGAGGMATVYLAEDLKHKRKVALKVLKPELAAVLGAERFVQEITTTASLQHPHILPLFDSGTAGGFLFYVMPFIDGETLRAKLDRDTQLGIDEALRITTAVAEALDYAHRNGVIHRDIKPENILLHDGRPMVADFGIALALSAAAGGRMTETGLSLGTPHYMSPEQATADRDITARSDIYSLGSVLYEMLTGSPPHVGSSAQQIIMKIVTEEAVPVTRVRKSVPVNVASAVAKAIEKLPADRFETAAAFAEALANPAFSTFAAAAGTPTAQPPHGPVTHRALAAVAIVATAVAVWGWLRKPPPPPVSRFNIALAEAQVMRPGQGPRIAISPDGSRFVYLGPGEGGAGQLWLRERDRLDARPLVGTEGAISPFFSPDGRRVGFYTISPMRLKTVSLGGEPPVTVADSGMDWDGGAWGRDGYIYSDTPDGLVRVPQGGGRPVRVTTLDTARGESQHNYPDVLPNGRGVVFTVLRRGIADYEVAVVDLATGVHRVLTRGIYGKHVAPGYLVYVTATGTLMAAPFDQGSMELTGDAAALAEGVSVRGVGYVDLALSATGTLLYSGGSGSGPQSDLVWVTRTGDVEVIDSNAYDAPVISPDGRRVAAAVTTQGETQIWIRLLPDGPSSKLTFDAESGRPFFAPDGRSVGFYTTRTGVRSLGVARADGSAPPDTLLVSPHDLWEGQWSRDGRWLVYRERSAPAADLMAVRTDGDATPVTLLASQYNERSPALSPDTRWIAYASDESGTDEVYVRPFPDVSGAKWQVSLSGGTEPLWANSGRELFYRSPAGDMVAAEIMTQPTFAVGRQTVLFAGGAFRTDQSHRAYDVSPDDRRFLMVRERGGGERTNLILVDNWFQELVAKVAR
ncbi:MAG TPA: protein kinase [Gemmatimonadales bacterium]|jgi:serine/threonine-protein kinase